MDHVRAFEHGDRVALGMGAGRMDQADLLAVEARVIASS